MTWKQLLWPRGRIDRAWWWAVFVPYWVIAEVEHHTNVLGDYAIPIGLALTYITVASFIMRLHDCNWRGWWVLLYFLNFVPWIASLVLSEPEGGFYDRMVDYGAYVVDVASVLTLGVWKGDTTANRFGEPPGATDWRALSSWLVPRGRIGRLRFVAILVPMQIGLFFILLKVEQAEYPVSEILDALLWVGLAASLWLVILRLHDHGRAGWWALAYYAPLLALDAHERWLKADERVLMVISIWFVLTMAVMFVHLYLRRGTIGANRFGPDTVVEVNGVPWAPQLRWLAPVWFPAACAVVLGAGLAFGWAVYGSGQRAVATWTAGFK